MPWYYGWEGGGGIGVVLLTVVFSDGLEQMRSRKQGRALPRRQGAPRLAITGMPVLRDKQRPIPMIL